MTGRRPLELRVGRPARPAAGRRRAASARGSARSRAAGRPTARRSAASAASESSRVAKLFISTSGSRGAGRRRSRRCRSWRAMTSRKLRPSLTGSSDLARVMPMLVPRPPLSLITTAGVEQLAAARSGVRERLGVRQLGDRLDLALAQDAVVAAGQPARVVLERRDGRLAAPSARSLSSASLRPGGSLIRRRLARTSPPPWSSRQVGSAHRSRGGSCACVRDVGCRSHRRYVSLGTSPAVAFPRAMGGARPSN